MSAPARYARTAQPGTIAHKVIEYLRLQPEGAEIATAVLAEAVGHDGQTASAFGQYLDASVRVGLLHKRMVRGIAQWSLGAVEATVPPPDEPAQQRQVTLDAKAAPSVFAYAASRRAAPFSVGLHTDGRMSIERNGRVVLELTDAERRTLVKSACYGVLAADIPGGAA
jgi:hypothetical protein